MLTLINWALTKGNYVVQEEAFYLGKYASVYQAEIVAIADACRCLKGLEKIQGSKVLICSDSLSAINALCSVFSNDQ